MTADEWCSFDKYAPRIKVFQNLCSSVIHGYEDIDVHVFNDLQSVRPDRPLFPSLQILQTPILSDADNTNLVMIPLLLPCLRRVDLFSTPVSSAYYLAHLVMQAPGLSHLRYVGSVGSSPLLSIAQFRHLSYLDINFHRSCPHFCTLSFMTMLNCLSTMPTLTSLLLSLPPSLLSDGLSHSGYAQLKSLALTGGFQSFAVVCGVAAHVEHLVLELDQDESIHNCTVFLDFLQSSCPCLEHITIFFGNHLSHTQPLLLINLLHPLLGYCLKSLCLRFDDPMLLWLADEDVHTLGYHWPDLQYLDLFAMDEYVTPNIPSLCSIAALTQACHNLAYLRMSIWNMPVELSRYRPSRQPRDLDNIYPPFMIVLPDTN